MSSTYTPPRIYRTKEPIFNEEWGYMVDGKFYCDGSEIERYVAVCDDPAEVERINALISHYGY